MTTDTDTLFPLGCTIRIGEPELGFATYTVEGYRFDGERYVFLIDEWGTVAYFPWDCVKDAEIVTP
jgi:hypothetical protein